MHIMQGMYLPIIVPEFAVGILQVGVPKQYAHVDH
jgi:hypothetical protein